MDSDLNLNLNVSLQTCATVDPVKYEAWLKKQAETGETTTKEITTEIKEPTQEPSTEIKYKIKETTEPVKPSAYFCGCAKNCEKYIAQVFNNIHTLGSACLNEYKILVFYDHSTDNTMKALMLEKIKCEKRSGGRVSMEIILNKKPVTKVRTENIANARNHMLERLRELNQTLNWEYFIMIDLDDVCSYPILTEVVSPYFQRNDWDGLTFNRKNYYDIWALSFTPFLFSCWNWTNPVKVVQLMRQKIIKKLEGLRPDQLLPCHSAFNGFGMYRISAFEGCMYNHNIPVHLISKDEMDENKDAINMPDVIPFIKERPYDCEHRHFHMTAKRNNNARIMISPQCPWEGGGEVFGHA